MSEIAPAGFYLADMNHSSLIWRIKHFGLAWYTRRFTRFDAKLDFEPNLIESMKLDVNVDKSSVRGEHQGDDKDWDDELANSTNFFDGKSHPTASFRSTAIERVGAMNAIVHGDLSIRGITHPLPRCNLQRFDARRSVQATLVGFSAKGQITRSQFGLTYFLGQL